MRVSSGILTIPVFPDRHPVISGTTRVTAAPFRCGPGFGILDTAVWKNISFVGFELVDVFQRGFQKMKKVQFIRDNLFWFLGIKLLGGGALRGSLQEPSVFEVMSLGFATTPSRRVLPVGRHRCCTATLDVTVTSFVQWKYQENDIVCLYSMLFMPTYLAVQRTKFNLLGNPTKLSQINQCYRRSSSLSKLRSPQQRGSQIEMVITIVHVPVTCRVWYGPLVQWQAGPPMPSKHHDQEVSKRTSLACVFDERHRSVMFGTMALAGVHRYGEVFRAYNRNTRELGFVEASTVATCKRKWLSSDVLAYHPVTSHHLPVARGDMGIFCLRDRNASWRLLRAAKETGWDMWLARKPSPYWKEARDSFFEPMQRDKTAFLPTSGGRTKEPSSIPLQLGFIKLYASRRGSLMQGSTRQYGADGTNPVFCDLGEPFRRAVMMTGRRGGQYRDDIRAMGPTSRRWNMVTETPRNDEGELAVGMTQIDIVKPGFLPPSSIALHPVVDFYFDDVWNQHSSHLERHVLGGTPVKDRCPDASEASGRGVYRLRPVRDHENSEGSCRMGAGRKANRPHNIQPTPAISSGLKRFCDSQLKFRIGNVSGQEFYNGELIELQSVLPLP
ncbi:hypothetical protein EV421DRAFT_1738045 [Armillaria borealis]|uniref:Uncharacterized protein n=1 Tax=Armillaria borealis TaxID=47425 RepID=A0AA39JAH6_9AGAR|nr:hypothetical protein EV421DRAFT_1738045 [Armillaria borealis]